MQDFEPYYVPIVDQFIETGEIVSETASPDRGVAFSATERRSAKGCGSIVCQRLERTETRLTALEGLNEDIGTAIGKTRRAAALAHPLDERHRSAKGPA